MALRTLRNIALILTLTIISGAVGYDLGRRDINLSWNNVRSFELEKVVNKQPPDKREVDFGLFWEVWDRVERDYIDKGDLDAQEMVWGAISGMVSSLDDPYTVFLPPEENKRSKEDLAGKFEGIGAQLGMKNKRLIIVAPLKGMPAEDAGLQPGDYILEVDGESTHGWTLPEAVNKIRGPRGSDVALIIAREGEQDTQEVSIVRDTIKVPSIETETGSLLCSVQTGSQTEAVSEELGVEENNTRDEQEEGTETCRVAELVECADCQRAAVLRLYRFGERTNGEWEQAVDRIVNFREQVMASGDSFAGIILDVRNNPGGFLQSAAYTAGEFVEAGKVVVQQQSKYGISETYRVERQGRLIDIPLVVIVNSGTASAGEILAGALQDHQRAVLVGEKTFGKGSVQEAQELPGGAGLHITTAKWLLPNGKSIREEGIDPDIIVENDPDDPESDAQMDRALRELLD